MQNLIDDLLTFSRTQFYVDAIQLVDLNEIMRNIKSAHELLINSNQLKIHSSDLPSVHGVPFQIQQLFENIISNSIKYRKPEKAAEITISWSVADENSFPNWVKGTNYLKFTFSDKGIGFDPLYSEKIFEIFQRLHGRSEYTGTGIGLAICKKIVENHKGFIFANSRVGEGASFDIYWPYKRPSR